MNLNLGGESDDKLMRRLRRAALKKDREMANEIMDVLQPRHEEPVRGYFGKRRIPAQDIDDLTAIVFAKVYRGATTFRPSKKFQPWFWRIVHNEYVQYWRECETPLPLSEGQDPEQPDRRPQADLDKAWEVCDPWVREVFERVPGIENLILEFLLCGKRRLAHAEFMAVISGPGAEGLGNTADKRVSRARRRIFDRLQPPPPGQLPENPPQAVHVFLRRSRELDLLHDSRLIDAIDDHLLSRT